MLIKIVEEFINYFCFGYLIVKGNILNIFLASVFFIIAGLAVFAGVVQTINERDSNSLDLSPSKSINPPSSVVKIDWLTRCKFHSHNNPYLADLADQVLTCPSDKDRFVICVQSDFFEYPYPSDLSDREATAWCKNRDFVTNNYADPAVPPKEYPSDLWNLFEDLKGTLVPICNGMLQREFQCVDDTCVDCAKSIDIIQPCIYKDASNSVAFRYIDEDTKECVYTLHINAEGSVKLNCGPGVCDG